MPSAPSLSQSVSRSPYLSHFTFRGLLSWRLLLRAIWLAAGLTYFYVDLTAELELHKTVNGRAQSPEQLIAEADWAVARFPFDPHLRAMRRWVKFEILKRQEEMNAAGQ